MQVLVLLQSLWMPEPIFAYALLGLSFSYVANTIWVSGISWSKALELVSVHFNDVVVGSGLWNKDVCKVQHSGSRARGS